MKVLACSQTLTALKQTELFLKKLYLIFLLLERNYTSEYSHWCSHKVLRKRFSKALRIEQRKKSAFLTQPNRTSVPVPNPWTLPAYKSTVPS